MSIKSDWVTMGTAAAMLGVSHGTMWQLVRDGTLKTQPNPLDRREKLIKGADIEALRSSGQREKPPWPRTIGAADLGVQSDEVEEWLEANRRP